MQQEKGKAMERKIGEVFEFNGVNLKVKRHLIRFSCKGCYFDKVKAHCQNMSCAPSERTDKENVIFMEIKE